MSGVPVCGRLPWQMRGRTRIGRLHTGIPGAERPLTYLKEREMEQRNYTYIVECSDGTLYTGWTNCIEKRLKDHNEGKGARFTRSRTPVTLRYLEISSTKSQAMSREAQIKKLSRREKQQLIENGELDEILVKYRIDISGNFCYDEKRCNPHCDI